MSHRTPPKSKTIARGSVVAGTTRISRRLGRGAAAVARERHPAVVLHALLVEDVVLAGAAVAVAPELFHRVVDVRLVPLSIPLGAAADQETRCDDEDEAQTPDHRRHYNNAAPGMLCQT